MPRVKALAQEPPVDRALAGRRLLQLGPPAVLADRSRRRMRTWSMQSSRKCAIRDVAPPEVSARERERLSGL
jgi:hypothetical protein